MAKRGDEAREAVKNKIIEAFSATGDYVAFQDKKIYVQAKDGTSGETLQFAITMTMPKTPIEVGDQPVNGTAWQKEEVKSTTLSSNDAQQVERLKQMLKEKGVYKE